MRKFTEAHGRSLSYEHQSAYPRPLNVSKEVTTAGMHVDINFALGALRNNDYFNPARIRAVSSGGSVLTVNNLVYGLVNDIDRSISRCHSQSRDRVLHSPFEGPEPTGPKMECSPSRVFLLRQKDEEVSLSVTNGGAQGVGNTVLSLAQLRHLRELNGVLRSTQVSSRSPPPPSRIVFTTPSHTRKSSSVRNLIPPVVPPPPLTIVAPPSPIPTLALNATPTVHGHPAADTPVPTPAPDHEEEVTLSRPSRYSARHKFELEPNVQTMARDTSLKIRAKGPSVGPLRKNFYMSRPRDAVVSAGRPNNNVSREGLRSMWKGDKDSSARQCIIQQKTV